MNLMNPESQLNKLPPKQEIIKNPLTDLVPVDEKILERALNSNGFDKIVMQVKNLSELKLAEHFEQDLKESYDDLGDARPKTIEELQQRFLIAQEHSEEISGSRDPLSANTLEYMNQRLTTITSLEIIVKEKPILLFLLKKEQQRLANLIISLEKFIPLCEKSAA